MPRRPGVYDVEEKFHFVPEMVPEFVVPDLTNFKVEDFALMFNFFKIMGRLKKNQLMHTNFESLSNVINASRSIKAYFLTSRHVMQIT